MTIEVNDVIRVQARMLRNGIDAVQNVYHVKHLTGAAAPEAAWVTDVSGLIDAEMFLIKDSISDNITSLDLLFFNLTQDAPMLDGSWATFVGGTNPGDPNPPQVSAQVFWRTAAARVIGRKFLPSMVESAQDDGNWTAALLVTLVIFVVNFIGALVVTGGTVTFGVFNGITAVFNAYTSGFAPTDSRTQRRRRTGVGA